MKCGNGATNQYHYDSLNRLTNLVWMTNGHNAASYYYQIGKTGNRTNLTEIVNTVNRSYGWMYDNLYRMTNETISGTGGGVVGYQFDHAGNRTNRQSSVTALPTAGYVYDTNDWLTTDGYDQNGNTTSSGVGYDYDPFNRLIDVPGTGLFVVYDGDGNRISKTTNSTGGSVIVYYQVDDRNPTGYPQVLEEYESRPNDYVAKLGRVYNYGLALISQQQFNTNTLLPSVTSYYGFDGHGSVRFLASTNQNITDTYVYDAYGTTIASTGSTPNNYLYCGEQFDPSLGMYYLRARYYKTDTGRFWTADTNDGNQEDPPSLHKYLYCANNPINFIDPLGMRYEFDSQGLHVHTRDSQGKLTYMVRINDDRTVVFAAKPGHEREFDSVRARADFSKAVRDPKEFRKIRDVVKDAYDSHSDKEGIARTGRNLRRARLVLGSLTILSWGLALDPSNADAVHRLNIGLSKIDRDVRKQTPPADGDIDDVMLAVKDIYGQDSLALWYWSRLIDMQRNIGIDDKIESGVRIGVESGVGQLEGF